MKGFLHSCNWNPEPNHQLPDNTEIQKTKGKSQDDNSRCKTSDFGSVILHFYNYIVHFKRIWSEVNSEFVGRVDGEANTLFLLLMAY
ncbi:MAG: hypothetical protein A2Z77_07110 [Chloroflexi bacterium RBG_13_51_36]|nr:MAG: hypothetical protein A2Z77_07110 [Chloroflexi bacterium RBG_13_51_36]